MNFFNRANSLSISILRPLILWPSPSPVGATGAVVGAAGVDVGTGGGAIFDVVGGAIGEEEGNFGGNGGVETIGGATLGGTTVVGLAVADTGGILGGVGIGEDGFDGGVPNEGALGGPIDGILGGPVVGGAGTPGTRGAVEGMPGVLEGGGGIELCPVLGAISPLTRSLDCSKLSAKDLYS